MAIRVVCPNGHALQLKDSLAGRTGLCPVCKAKVRVPKPQRGDVSEDAILDFLGPAAESSPEPAKEIRIDQAPEEGIMESLGFSGPRKRLCEKCDKEIDAGAKVCPNCNTYLPNLAGQ